MTVRVFVSYRRDDSKHAAGRLYERLHGRFQLFMDIDQIPYGADFAAVVRTEVQQTDVVVALIGSIWLSCTTASGGRRIDQPDDWVAEEIGTALELGKPIIPVLVDDARMPAPAELPPRLAALSTRNALTITHESFASDAGRLIEAIESTLSAQAAQLGPAVDLWADPDYPQARAAFLQQQWPVAIRGFELALRRHPGHPRLVEQLAEARHNQRLADLHTTEQARRRLRVLELRRDVQALAAAGAWDAVVAAGSQLAELDPAAADPDGLVSLAQRRGQPEPAPLSPPTPRRSRRALIAVLAAVVLVAVIVSLVVRNLGENNGPITGNTPNTSATSSPSESSSESPSESASPSAMTAAHRALLKDVPSPLNATCQPYAVSDPKLLPGLRVALHCTPTGSSRADHVEYFRYATASAMDTAFAAYAGADAARGCEGIKRWSFNGTPDTTEGNLTCFNRDDYEYAAWTRSSTKTLHSADSRTLTEPQIHAWWKIAASW